MGFRIPMLSDYWGDYWGITGGFSAFTCGPGLQQMGEGGSRGSPVFVLRFGVVHDFVCVEVRVRCVCNLAYP